MPPVIKLYSDAKCTKAHTGEIGIVDAGTEMKETIYCRNEGNGTLDSVRVQLTPDSERPLPAELVGEAPKQLAPGKVWPAIIRWQVHPKEKAGLRRAEIKITGRFIE